MSTIADRLSLSTCWCSSRHTDGYEMVEEMVGLGFKRIELSHGIRMLLVPGILAAVEEGLVEISSVHNFCPLPSGVQFAAPNLYQPSANDPREQNLWLNYTLQTLDFAAKVKAPHVVIHSGSAWFFLGSPEKKFEEWLQSTELKPTEMAEDAEFIRQRNRAIKRIQRASKKPMRRLKENLESILLPSKEKGLCLGIENREGLEELPLDAQHAEFVRSLPEVDHCGYWHDTGHAEIKAQYGLLNHRSRLEELKDRLIGWHLHDVSESGKDHRELGTGVIDFNMIAEFIEPEHSLVLELSPSLKVEQVERSRDFVLSLLS